MRNRSEKENLQAALDMAKEAEQSSLQERIRRFGFHSRFQPRGSSQGCTILKEQENTASRPRVQGPPAAESEKKKKKKKKEKKNPATSSTDQEKLLHETSGAKPDARLKRTIDMKGDKKPQSGGLENAPPASKKSQPERSYPKAAAVCPGYKRATGKQDRSQKGLKTSSSGPPPPPPPREESQARHPLRSPTATAAIAFSPPRPSWKDRSNRFLGLPGI